MRIPPALREEWHTEPDWLAALPRLAAECAERWDLTLEHPFESRLALIIAAGDVVLKLNAPSHIEAQHEGDALARWSGHGAVRLIAHDEERRALLLERCRPGTPLCDTSADETAVLAVLQPRLSVAVDPPHPFRLLADEAERWAEDLPRRYTLGGRPFERPLLDFSVAAFRDVDPRSAFLANQDLHSGNVLSGEREPWLVIDPKPLVGERELDGVGLLRNAAWDGGTALVGRWLGVLESLGLDRERLRALGVAHVLAWGWDDERGWSPRSVDVARVIFGA